MAGSSAESPVHKDAVNQVQNDLEQSGWLLLDCAQMRRTSDSRDVSKAAIEVGQDMVTDLGGKRNGGFRVETE